jgi:hypothetical protein
MGPMTVPWPATSAAAAEIAHFQKLKINIYVIIYPTVYLLSHDNVKKRMFWRNK